MISETISLESPPTLLPFIRHLIQTDKTGTTQLLGNNELLPNETYTLLEQRLDEARLLSGLGERESIRMSLSNRESSAMVETFFKIYEEQVASRDEVEVTKCENWIEYDGQQACTELEFWKLMRDSTREDISRPLLFPFDHLVSTVPSLPLAILYASPSNFGFTPLFTLLDNLAESSSKGQSRIQFALRWKPESASKGDKLVLSGYGAGLEIKKVDYIAIDDRLQKLDSGDLVDSSDGTRSTIHAVPKSDLADLGVRAAQHILASSDPLATFVSITANFPVIASQLKSLVPVISDDLVSEILGNQMGFQVASSNSFYLNGIELSTAEVDPFALLRMMRKERSVMAGIMSLDKTITPVAARSFLTFQAPADPSQSRGTTEIADALGEIFDSSDREEGGNLILWWNDLEKDKRYAGWTTKLREMLQPTYPGQMNLVARNLHNVVLVVDLSKIEHLLLISESIREFITRGIPVRFGLVPQFGKHDEISTMVAQVVWYLTDVVGRSPVMKLMSELIRASEGDFLTEPALRKIYDRSVARLKRPEGELLLTFDEVQKSTTRLDQARSYANRLGVRFNGGPGAFFMNGVFNTVDDNLPGNLQRVLGMTTQLLQQAIYLNQAGPSNATTYFYDLPTTYKRRNPYIFPSTSSNPLNIVDLVDVFSVIDRDLAQSPFIEGISQEEGARDHSAIITIYLVTDLDAAESRSLVRSALEFVDKNLDSRIFLVHNPLEVELSSHPYFLSDLLYLLGSADSPTEVLPSELLDWLDLDIQSSGPPSDALERMSGDSPIVPWLLKGSVGTNAKRSSDYWTKAKNLVAKFGLKPGESGMVINGRVVGPFEPTAFASPADFTGIKSYELEKRILPVMKALIASTFDFELLDRTGQSQLISFLTSIISKAAIPDTSAGFGQAPAIIRQQPYRSLGQDHSVILSGKEDSAVFEIGVVIDPASELAQRWSHILRTLSQLESVHLRIHFNPNRFLPEVPIKRFYQYSFDHALEFDRATGLEVPASITFKDVPETILLTFATDLQRSWLAFPKQSVYDLDNIRLAQISDSARQNGINALLELESIILEGHSRDMPSQAPPRGLQLELSNGSNKDKSNITVDTIVMANLGYWQLKANPGIWQLAIRPGKSSEVFDLESIGSDGMNSPDIRETGNLIAVTTLEGSTLYPRFRRNKGFETVELLDDNAAASRGNRDSVMNKFRSFFVNKDEVAIKKRAEINVFTVASGLLYERMAFIMMVSVMRHTNSTVKFWFIQNFLSPSFRAFIPHMALEYGFEYELITYSWPHWLRAQKEKQRIIWGYKILFLDVLFPIELDRVIFVDSDQIVRTDLRELIDMDIQGAPYAYAPMGDDRKEVEGFRFWKTGYWKNHLKGATYHISALYLVDLDRFRQIAAGDRLRQQYQALSADPNSLANLDQDLPNFMYANIPIFTLDKSWLYCETWHSPEALAAAKTIDLCNDPLTHEPKLVRAKRIPEWTVYDDEIAALAARVAVREMDNGAEIDSAIGAFAKAADKLEQATQQFIERDEFVAEHAGDGKLERTESDARKNEEHSRDEL